MTQKEIETTGTIIENVYVKSNGGGAVVILPLIWTHWQKTSLM